MEDSSPCFLLVVLILTTSLGSLTNSVNAFRKKPNDPDDFFKLPSDDTIEDLTIISPDQFEREETNNELKTSKQFDEDNLDGGEGDFYEDISAKHIMKDIYDVKDKPIHVVEDKYGKESSQYEKTSTQLGNRRKGQKFRDQYQIEEAPITTEMEKVGYLKPFEDVRTNNDRNAKVAGTKKLKQKSADFYETLKSKPSISNEKSAASSLGEKLLRHHQPRGKSPEEFGLKHSEEPPFPDLVESANKLHDPPVSDLNATRLMAKLGSYYDSAFMSVVKPHLEDNFENRSEQDILQQFTRNKNGRLIPKEELPDYLKDINFKYIYLSDGNRIRTRISNKLKKKMQQFLQAYTKCRIAYKWKDLGVRFWPRYFRHGYCSDGGRGSCSIPPGMTCKPSLTEYKTLLRYHCKGSGDGKCHWRSVQYPVVTRCDCGCP
uniref:Noggin n=1 Tax=Cacopsylla melanoneura TaxID=428564 RepID=A0A8D8S4X1_9HEMI